MEFEESQTYKNVQNAYNNDLMSGTRYRIFSDKAVQDGYMEISNEFNFVARNELEHARIWLRQLNNGRLPTTEENVTSSIEFFNYYGNDLYRQYAQTALAEGFDHIAALFNGIANIELNHLLTFQTIQQNFINNTVFCKNTETLWICMACGNILSGKCAPNVCPICGLPQGYYKLYIPPELEN